MSEPPTRSLFHYRRRSCRLSCRRCRRQRRCGNRRLHQGSYLAYLKLSNRRCLGEVLLCSQLEISLVLNFDFFLFQLNRFFGYAVRPQGSPVVVGRGRETPQPQNDDDDYLPWLLLL